MPDLNTPRREFVAYLHRQLVGPAEGSDEVLIEPPTKRYSMGILFPQGTECAGANREEEVDEQPSSGGDDGSESPISLAFQRLPASMGVSFFMTGTPSVRCEVWAGRYEEQAQEEERSESDVSKRRAPRHLWRRVPIAEQSTPESAVINKESGNHTARPVLGGKASVDVQWRSYPRGHLVTVTLLNTQHGGERPDPAQCLCQVGFRCQPADGLIGTYPHHTRLSLDEEDEDLALAYRLKLPYAVGHGCAAVWDEQGGNRPPHWITAEVMPTQEVKPITTVLPPSAGGAAADGKVLTLQYLADESVSGGDLGIRLSSFLDGYAAWIEDARHVNVPAEYGQARERVLERLDEALTRMRRGVRSLCDESRPDILRAFRWAQFAMLQQMIHSGPGYSGTLRPLGEGRTAVPDYAGPANAGYAWRPFQLAFQLLAINGLVDQTPEDKLERELVDLIWFPTGGGKTEAYLALAAFEIIHRRLRNGPRGAGTAVIKRYTLRLLTTQQFERAAALITALELMRKKREDRLGTAPIRLGLWVGGDTSPNKYGSGDPARPGAKELLDALLQDDEPRNPFQLQKCPWCGTRLVPERRSPDPTHYGVEATPGSFRFYCPDSACLCHETIPVSVVDEDLYDHPPSLVIGTIDKFARMAWDPASRSFFAGRNEGVDPPSLIIQDELHLIAGPLGTIAGVYESAVDTVIRTLGKAAKVIAATATIRRAGEQVERLYARPVRVFPPRRHGRRRFVFLPGGSPLARPPLCGRDGAGPYPDVLLGHDLRRLGPGPVCARFQRSRARRILDAGHLSQQPTRTRQNHDAGTRRYRRAHPGAGRRRRPPTADPERRGAVGQCEGARYPPRPRKAQNRGRERGRRRHPPLHQHDLGGGRCVTAGIDADVRAAQKHLGVHSGFQPHRPGCQAAAGRSRGAVRPDQTARPFAL